MVAEQIQEPLALEDADSGFGHRLHAVLQRLLHRALQSHHVAGKQEIHDLPPAVFHGLEAEQHALEHGVEMRIDHALRQHLGALGDIQFALLKSRHELDLALAQRPEARSGLERTVRARDNRTIGHFRSHWRAFSPAALVKL